MSQTHTPSTARRVDVVASLAMESMLRSLELPVAFRYASEQVSMETSQQLQEQERTDLLIAHHENLQKLLKADKPTGTPHLFVLDPEQLAVGDTSAHATLQALASQQFSNPGEAAIAMLPPASGFTVAGQAAADLVKTTVLTDTPVVALESVDDLKAWLNVDSTQTDPST